MKSLLGNSCAKGCLVYLVALVAIIAVTAAGLGGLKGRFNADAVTTQGTVYTENGQPASRPQAPAADGGDGLIIATSTPQPLPTIAALPTVAIAPTLPPGSTGPGIIVQYTPVPAQGGVISGEASAPFYIVQPDNTLWDIALRYGVDVETLQSINNIGDDVILPGQILYLPQPQSSQQSGLTPQSMPTIAGIPAQPDGRGGGQPTAVIPQMPNTGIIKRP